jgi:uncharacterized protein
MSWILTHTGRRFNLEAPLPSMVCIEDIAWHLSLVNRFTGATARPYSVAEHSLLVAEILERTVTGIDAMCLRAALLHDAAEAYTNDLSSPMKALAGAWWREAERKVERAVHAHFGTEGAARQHAIAIHYADRVALATERRDLMPPHAEPWPCLQDVEPVEWIDLNAREGMDWTDWRLAYLAKHEELAALCEAVAP